MKKNKEYYDKIEKEIEELRLQETEIRQKIIKLEDKLEGSNPCYYRHFKIKAKADKFLSDLRNDEDPEGYNVIPKSKFDDMKEECEDKGQFERG